MLGFAPFTDWIGNKNDLEENCGEGKQERVDVAMNKKGYKIFYKNILQAVNMLHLFDSKGYRF